MEGKKRGIYDVLGTFFFIGVALAVVIGLIYYGYFVAGVEEKIDYSLSKYDSVKEIKEKIFDCYASNNIIDRNRLSAECFVRGYRLSVIEFGDCREEVLKESDFSAKEKVTYAVNVYSADEVTVCPGKLEVST